MSGVMFMDLILACVLQLGIEGGEPFGGADIDPAAAVMFAADLSGGNGFKQQWREFGWLATDNAGEERRTIDADAAECVTCRIANADFLIY
jgi:hypothetical protein